MAESRCCICHKTTNWFYENISLLQAIHSGKSIAAVMELILGEGAALTWCDFDDICYECVDMVNEYDDAYKKLQSIERKLKMIHQNAYVQLENPISVPSIVNVTSDGREFYANDFLARNVNSEYSEDPSSLLMLSFASIQEPFEKSIDSETTGIQSNDASQFTPLVNAIQELAIQCNECDRKFRSIPALSVKLIF